MKVYLDVVEVLGLGDGGGQAAVAEGADHQLSVHTDHLAELIVCILQCMSVAVAPSIWVGFSHGPVGAPRNKTTSTLFKC